MAPNQPEQMAWAPFAALEDVLLASFLAEVCLQELSLSANGPFQVAGPVYKDDLQVRRCFSCLLGGLSLVFV